MLVPLWGGEEKERQKEGERGGIYHSAIIVTADPLPQIWRLQPERVVICRAGDCRPRGIALRVDVHARSDIHVDQGKRHPRKNCHWGHSDFSLFFFSLPFFLPRDPLVFGWYLELKGGRRGSQSHWRVW